MTISIDDDLKHEFTDVCKAIGLSPSAAITIFAKTVVRERSIPFTLTAESADARAARAYDQAIYDGVMRAHRQFESGDFLTREASLGLRSSQGASE